jgi:hypothetical protein
LISLQRVCAAACVEDAVAAGDEAGEEALAEQHRRGLSYRAERENEAERDEESGPEGADIMEVPFGEESVRDDRPLAGAAPSRDGLEAREVLPSMPEPLGAGQPRILAVADPSGRRCVGSPGNPEDEER